MRCARVGRGGQIGCGREGGGIQQGTSIGMRACPLEARAAPGLREGGQKEGRRGKGLG